MNTKLVNNVGFTLTELASAGLTFGASGIDASLRQLASTGAKEVTLSWQVKTVNSVAIDDRHSTINQLTHVIDYAHSLGLQVALKPNLFGESWSWSGVFTPTNPSAWFASYGQLLNTYAQIAQQHGVEQLLLTNEASLITTNKDFSTYWSNIVTSIRTIYTGQLGVNATVLGDEASNLTFGKLIDFIGLSDYSPLTNLNDPSINQISQALISNRSGFSLIDYINQLHTKYDKPIKISELAIMSTDGSNINPSNQSLSGPIDYGEQTNAYMGILQGLIQNSGDWLTGINIWGWFSDTNPVPLFYKQSSSPPAWQTHGGLAIQDNQSALNAITTFLKFPRISVASSDGASSSMIALDVGPTQNAGSAYMLYKAAFNHEPDTPGLGFWINRMDSGMEYNTVAQNFVNSDEFKTAYGGSNPTVNTLVTKLYNNVLIRTPDAGGLTFWQDKLTTGGWTVANVLGYFATSNENVTNVASLIANGIAYQEWVG